MKKIFKKFKGIFCFTICLCIAVATFQVGVFAEESGVIVNSKLLQNNDGTVYGNGILSGLGDNGTPELNQLCYNKETGENRGYDNSQANDIVCSFDTVTYRVNTTLQNLGNVNHTITYEFIIPNDDELVLSTQTVTSDKIPEPVIDGNNKIYTISKELNVNEYNGGAIGVGFGLQIKNKHQDDTIEPTINVYVDNDKNHMSTVDNMKPVIVTTAPMYNIVLKKKTETIKLAEYNFDSDHTGYYGNPLLNGKDKDIKGYKINYGVALEVRKPGNGMRGVELPDPTKPFKFDVDLSEFTVNGINASSDFTPLLYRVCENKRDGDAVTDIAYSNKNASGNANDRIYCSNSGNYVVTQEGTTLHFEVTGYDTDFNHFPTGYENMPIGYSNGDINSILEGVFSTQQFQVVYPNNNETTSLSSYNPDTTGKTNISATAKVINMHAYSEVDGNVTTKETKIDDNKQTSNWDNTSPGSRNQSIFYSSTSNKKTWTDEYTPGKKFTNVDGDIAAVGATDLGFTVGYDQTNIISEDGNINNYPVAIDQLVLFNRNAFDEVKMKNFSREDTGYKCKISYGISNDGEALTNESMRTKNLSDFKFYDSLEDMKDDLKNNGRKQTCCDVVYVQYRGCPTKKGKPDVNLLTQFTSNLKKNPNIADQVYMVTAVTNTWSISDMQAYEQDVREYRGKTNGEKLNSEDWKQWIWHKTEQGKKPDELFKNINPSNATLDYRNEYTVPTYENGVYSDKVTPNNNITFADGIYVVPYTTSITKQVAQKSNGESRKFYNVSSNERYVDYKIDSKMSFWDNVTIPEGSTTTVYLEDTLPDGLTYIPNSAYWGGNYKSQFPKQGKVEGGKAIEPTISTNENGKTVLKWKIKKVNLVNGTLPSLYYSCKIGNTTDLNQDVNNNDVLQNTINIQTDEDKRPFTTYNNNEVTTSITVNKNNEFYLGKTGKSILELEDKGDFNLLLSNVNSNARDDVFAVDTMPQDGYDGTIMKGIYKLTGLTLDKAAIGDEINDVEIWYTNNAEKYGRKKADEIKASDVTEENSWKKAEIVEENGKVIIKGKDLIGAWPTVIAYKDKKLKGNCSFKLKMEYAAIAAEGDHLLNSISTLHQDTLLSDDASVDVVKRSLEGTVWIDKDKDGKLEDGEKRVENVKVIILKKNGDCYESFEAYEEVVQDGDIYKTITHPTTITTDKNGHYKFEGLPEGEYTVVFESSDQTSLEKYEATIANQGSDKESSKVTSDNIVTKSETDQRIVTGSIPNLTMPSKEEMINNGQYEYNLPNQNLGLIEPIIHISGEKIWDDVEDYDGLRPNSIGIQIKNGDTIVKTITVTKDNNWKWSVDMPKYDNQGQVIQYTIDEVDVAHYNKTINYDEDTKSYQITNKHKVEKITIPVEKVWNDNNNNDGKRTKQVIVHLYADGKDTGKTLTLSDTNHWKDSFVNLDQYSNGNKINYTVKEEKVNGYEIGYTGSQDKGYIITNTHDVETVEVKGTKTWNDNHDQDGKRPENITVRLYADGVEIASKVVDKDSNWTYDFGKLSKYKKGKEINYTVDEDEVAGYTTEINNYDITNTHKILKTSVNVTKEWNDQDNQDGKRAKQVIVHLYANGKDTGKTLTLSDDNQWISSFDDLNQYKDGKEIVYTVQEDEVKGYKVGITGNQKDGYIITNSHDVETVHLKGTKTWIDNHDQAHQRPDTIRVRLYADGKEIAFLDVSKSQDWTYDFGNLSKYKEGKEINYTTSEDYVKGYNTSIDGMNITNTYVPVITTVKNDTTQHKLSKILTGDNTNIGLYLGICVLAIIGLYLLKKQKA